MPAFVIPSSVPRIVPPPLDDQYRSPLCTPRSASLGPANTVVRFHERISPLRTAPTLLSQPAEWRFRRRFVTSVSESQSGFRHLLRSASSTSTSPSTSFETSARQ